MPDDPQTHSAHERLPKIGVVLIGRNEGERLQRCLESIARHRLPTVYVDSGSTDTSVERAMAMGAEIVRLSVDIPFTAARARNEGFACLMKAHQDVTHVQFIDGDCELSGEWLTNATEFMTDHPDMAIVCGRRSERYPDRSIYNTLCDMEWNTPVGEADSSGGDFLARVDAFRSIDGFNGSLVAGEEPEMCYRLRLGGWKIYRLDSPMTLHDADMHSFVQWVRRTSRTGYAYAARAFLHWRAFNPVFLRENARVLFWGLAFPAVALLLTVAASPWFALLFLIYVVQYWRIYKSTRSRYPARAARAYALFTVLGKWAELYGQLIFIGRLIGRKEQRLIEYK
jgi:glycosyltransferase involved in cell wall biosynthesis